MANPRVAVVGAGLAGLAAGLDLAEAGWEVSLFERSRLLGGKATSFTVDGVEVDNGQHVFLGCCTAFRDFVRRLGMTHHLYLQDRFEALVLKAGAPMSRLRAARLPAPWHLVAAFSRYPHLDWSGRLQVARALLQAGRGHLDGSGMSFADWLNSQGQSERTKHAFWEPFMVPALNADLERVSAEAAGFVIKTAFMSDAAAACFGFATVPLARFAEAAAARLASVHLRAVVAGLIHPDGAFRGIRLESGEEFDFEAVVLAIPPRQLARLLGEDRLGLDHLDDFETEPILDVHLWYEGEPAPFGFAAVLGSPVQWVFQKASGYLCCSLSAAHDLVRRPESELVELCARELEQALPALGRDRLRRGAATRDTEATFIPRPGLKRPGARTVDPAVAIAGAWTDTGWPATMESAILSGHAAARALLGAEIAVAA